MDEALTNKISIVMIFRGLFLLVINFGSTITRSNYVGISGLIKGSALAPRHVLTSLNPRRPYQPTLQYFSHTIH